ncbi:MAG TPA: hypothetical protein VFH50_10910 [Acidimicrobiales bacterium]|nr:hypothetical protein [Acidimicrobiales bacterium]
MRRVAAALCAVLLAGCAADAAAGTAAGGSGERAGVAGPLRNLTSSLAPLHRGVLDFEVVSSPGLDGGGREVGYRLSGPFSDPPPGQRLPVLRLTVETLGGADAATTIVSSGQRAWIESGGSRQPLTAAQTAQLAAGVEPGGDLTGLGQLGVAGWARAPGTVSHATIGGAPVEEVTAPVDPVAALNGIESLLYTTSGVKGRPIPADSGAAAALRRATRTADVVVAAGSADHLLRLLQLRMTFAAPAGDQLRSALGPVAGLRFSLVVQIGSPG